MHSAGLNPIAGRFVWKEYRALRGLWLAVLVLGLFIQWVSGASLPRQTDFATVYFSIALAAAALYAVGAAATTFSVEHEEETYGFLAGLPTTWLPVFAGKLAFAAASALALAAALAIAGWIACGFDTPGGFDTPMSLAIFGLAIVEALAWGTLFSLLVKRPLLAAILTLAVGTIVVQLAVSASSQQAAPLSNPQAYMDAVPLRLAIIAVVFFAGTAVARRWLTTPRRVRRGDRDGTTPLQSADQNTTPWTSLLSNVAGIIKRLNSSRRGVLLQLVWQSWRQSWKLLLAPVALAAFLAIGIQLLAAFVGELMGLLTIAALLFLPGLYGALVFSGDQRRRQYRFLAEHAAPPRYVWFARHLVWGGMPLLILVLVAIGVQVLANYGVVRAIERFMDFELWQNYDPSEIANNYSTLSSSIRTFARGAGVALCGMFVAYSVGQFFSMLLQSEIMAAFLACVVSVVVAAWCVLMFGWELSGLWFILPLGVGLLLATWLRAPAWLTERNSWRHWLAPAAAVLLPAAAVLAMIPGARLAQVSPATVEVAEAILAPVRKAYHAGDTPAARETADMYLRAADSAEEEVMLENDPLEPWFEKYPELAEKEIPANDWADYSKAVSEHERRKYDARREAFELFLAATRRPTCRFDFQGGPSNLQSLYRYQRNLQQYFESGDRHSDTRYSHLARFMIQLAQEVGDEGSLDRYMALLRASAHVRSAQPTSIFTDQLMFEAYVLELMADWAKRDKTSTDDLREAIDQLQAHFETSPRPDESLFADRDAVRQSLVGNQLPVALEMAPKQYDVYLAYLFNQLPWELERSLLVLDVTTANDIHRAAQLLQYLAGEATGEWQFQMLLNEAVIYRAWNQFQPFASLGEREYLGRVDFGALALELVNLEVQRRATLLQMAMIRYHRDHEHYPDTLAELAPMYLKSVPLDPYSGEPFQYLPRGLDLPLNTVVQGRVVSSAAIVPAFTPFFWSVGPWNLSPPEPEMRESEMRELDEFAADNPEAEPVRKMETVYVLRERSYADFRIGFGYTVFPLPQ